MLSHVFHSHVWKLKPIILALWRMKQEEREFGVSLGYRTLAQNRKKKNQEKCQVAWFLTLSHTFQQPTCSWSSYLIFLCLSITEINMNKYHNLHYTHYYV